MQNSLSESHNCPFCSIQAKPIWRSVDRDVTVIPNAYSALELENPAAYGRQELVIETPDHDQRFSDLSVGRILVVFDAYRRRLTSLQSLRNIRYVLIFKNEGLRAGATEPHAHSQILALPLVPPKIQRETDALNHYWDIKGSCALCDVSKWESDQKVRNVAQDKYFTIVSPYAASHAYELWVIPQAHRASFADLNQNELTSLAVFMKKITAKLDEHGIDFNFFLQESLANQEHHFVVKIEPRHTTFAGAELGAGIVINSVAPEFAALWYQNKAE